MTERQIVQADAEAQAIKRGVDPLMERPFSRLLAEVPKRFLTMLMKLLGMRGVAFGIATWLVVQEKIPAWAWMSVVLVLIFGEKALKFLRDVRGGA